MPIDSHFLTDYSLSWKEAFHFPMISGYGLRHLRLSNSGAARNWSHRIIGLIECCPIIGHALSLIEIALHTIWDTVKSWSNHLRMLHTKKIFTASSSGSYGFIDQSRLQSLCNRIEKDLPNSIRLKRDNLCSSLSGGACSAISLDFTARVRLILNSHPLERALIKLEPHFIACDADKRVTQAALNALIIKEAKAGIDIEKEKVRAILFSTQLDCDSSTREYDVKKTEDQKDFKKDFQRLSNGLYFCRIRLPAENEKKELRGHSCIFLKQGKKQYYFDCNLGLYDLEGEASDEFLWGNFQHNESIFGCYKARLYRICAKKPAWNFFSFFRGASGAT